MSLISHISRLSPPPPLGGNSGACYSLARTVIIAATLLSISSSIILVQTATTVDTISSSSSSSAAGVAASPLDLETESHLTTINSLTSPSSSASSASSSLSTSPVIDSPESNLLAKPGIGDEDSTLVDSPPPPSSPSSSPLPPPSLPSPPPLPPSPAHKSPQHISEQEVEKLGEILKVHPQRMPQLKKIGKKVNNLINRVQANDGFIRPDIFVHELIPDPLPVKDIEVKNEESLFSYYEGKFTNVMLHGISSVQIQSIRANVGNFTAKIIIHVPSVYLTGQYSLNGKVMFVDVEGKGNFYMNITDIEIDAFGNLNRTIDEQTGKPVLQIGNIELDVSPGDMNLVFENLSVFGSEAIAETIVGTMSGLIFSQVKYTVLEKTSTKIRARINQRLAKIPIEFIESESETLFDDLVHHIAKKVGTKLEPLRLPVFRRNLSARMLVLDVNALINIHDGQLYGLTTFARTGDIYITYEDDAVLIEADVGFRNITGSYRWDFRVLGRGPSGSSSLTIRKIAAYMRIRQELRRGSVPKLQRFRVEEIDHVWLDMNGLGVWDYLLEMVINAVSNVFRVTIANLIANRVTGIIQEELEAAKVSFIP